MELKKLREAKGITMVALVITITVMLILATITINLGKETIKQTKLESLKTDMLLIEAKAKEYVESASFELGNKDNTPTEGESQEKIDARNKRKENALAKLKGQETTDQYLQKIGLAVSIETEKNNNIYYYQLSQQDLKDMGLKDVLSDEDEGFFIVKYDIPNADVEVYLTNGIEVEGVRKYSLTDLKAVE